MFSVNFYWVVFCLMYMRLATAAIILNPILPGFHPDPSCIHVLEDGKNSTVYCITSSFSTFPGLPIYASHDLRHWTLVSHVLNRPDQLPQLASIQGATSGIWAATLRQHENVFYVTTTLVHDDRSQQDASRWENLIFQSHTISDSAAWSLPVPFNFTGYDPSPFWDDDGQAYMVAGHAWRVDPGISLAPIDLTTGTTGSWKFIWNGTGGLAPEGPHIYRHDGYYYLVIAEGGTGLNHSVTMARSQSLGGPYTPHPNNPVLSNAGTDAYFQTIGHADLFRDPSTTPGQNDSHHWWAAALATRSGPAYQNYPMGRETVLTRVIWPPGAWPVWEPVRGSVDSDDLERENEKDTDLVPEILTFSSPPLPAHFVYWRPPERAAYEFENKESHNEQKEQEAHQSPTRLRLRPSWLNLTGLDGSSASDRLGRVHSQTFVGRRQQHSLFVLRVWLDFQPIVAEHEAGLAVFLTQNHHFEIGLITASDGHLRPIFHGFARGFSLPLISSPAALPPGSVILEVAALNTTHYVFGAASAEAVARSPDVAIPTLTSVSNEAVSWGFSGVLLGIYCTSNGGNGTTPVHVTRWEYRPQRQIRDNMQLYLYS